jgi:hypothetical protein
MRKATTVILLAVVLLVVTAVVSHADRGRRGHRFHGHRHGHHGIRSHVVIGIGPAFWWRPYPYWYAPPPHYIYSAPLVVIQEPPVYLHQQTVVEPAPPGYWYYCPSAKAYYPQAQTCPEVWIKVPPRPE